ncbi:epoxide hydrolase 1 [Trichonephila clavata]|uniref:Epoxide hydrolase 1 n=1 Tax=Trichonephila clavata TaxID=2740835 RepID=A0A8X6HFK2_TRICU|nr:epoxide hydrolase 1 [Trichonephila clavata]
MSDSPAGMAAYIMEKFPVAINAEFVRREDGGLTEKFTLDELLTNVMFYWNSYFFWISVTVPSAVALFPNEVLMRTKTLMSQQMPNMVSCTIMPRGGHFAALEEPLLLADDLWKFVDIVEKKYKS